MNTTDKATLSADLKRFEASKNRQNLNTPAYLEYERLCADLEREICSREVIEDEFTPPTEESVKAIVSTNSRLSQ